MIWYKRINSVFFTGTLLAHTFPLTRGNKYSQLYVKDKGFVMIYLMKSQSEFNDTLHCFSKDIGVPVSLVMNNHMAQKNNKTKKLCHQVGKTLHILEVGTPWANHAKIYISPFKEPVRRDLLVTNSPMVLRD